MRILIIILLAFTYTFPITLDELIKKALEGNPQVLAKKYELNSAKLRLKGDENLYFPEFIIGYKYSWQSDAQSISIPSPIPMEIRSSKKNYQALQAGIRQILYDGGLRDGTISLSKSLLYIAEREYEEVMLDVKLEVIRAYLSVLSSLELIEVIEKQREAIQSDLRQREAFYREGLVAITDVLQARVKLAEVERDLRKAQGDYRIALANLSRITGIEEKDLTSLEPVNLKVELPTLEELIEKAISKRPIIKMARERLKISKEQRTMELSSFHPKVFLEAFYNYSDQNTNLRPKGFFTISGGISVNFQSLAPYYRALSYGEEEKKAKEELKDTVEKITLGVKASYEKVMTARDNLKVAEEALRLAEEFYRLSLAQYRNQIISGTDLLQAEASLTQARKAKVLAYYELLGAYFELLREVGEL